MTHPFPPFTDIPPIDETIWADGDLTVSDWESQSGDQTNIFEYVNSNNDATNVELRSAAIIPDTVICGIDPDEVRILRFFVQNPSADPSPDQTVQVKCKCRYVDLFGATGEEASVAVKLREGTTQIAVTSQVTLDETLSDITLTLSVAEINSVGDWEDLNIEMRFEACSGDSIPNAGDLDLECSQCRIIFST